MLALAAVALVAAGTSATSPAEVFPLSLDRTRFFPAPLVLEAEDFALTLEQGGAVLVLAGGRPTGLALAGKGRARFAPPVRSERNQLRLLCGSETLDALVDGAWIRFHPDAYPALARTLSVRESPPPDAALRRAEILFAEESGRSYALPVRKGEPPLSVLPPRGDFLAELATERFGRLAYARVGEDPEDVILVDRARGIRIASYPSSARRARGGLDYGDETGVPYEALRYDLDVELDPAGPSVSGRVRVSLRALESLTVVKLALDRGLAVTEVRSAERGLHDFARDEKADGLFVRVDPPLAADERIVLETTFSGRVRPQDLTRRKSAAGERPPDARTRTDAVLLSNLVYWFPQSPVRNHTPATISVKVPSGWTALASGLASPEAAGPGRFAFATEKPIRYLSLLAGRFREVADETTRAPIPVRAVAPLRLATRGRALASEAARIVRFYSDLVGDAPYPALTLSLVETVSPAAHSPAYLTVLGEPAGWEPRSAPDDPTYFAREPVFSLAHEIAHQWWGQAVGWRNYREQWLSEGLSQYFAALYLRDSRGEAAFERALDWMRRWALEAAGQGTIDLGIRAGEVTGCADCFPAIVYDRAACVLHMLRRLVGEETFFRALRFYYERWRFRRAGASDLETAFEEVSGRDLSQFFERWVRDAAIPTVSWSALEVSRSGRPALRLVLQQDAGPFVLPLTVSLEHRDGSAEERVVVFDSERRELFFDLERPLRRARVRADAGALFRLREVAQLGRVRS